MKNFLTQVLTRNVITRKLTVCIAALGLLGAITPVVASQQQGVSVDQPAASPRGDAVVFSADYKGVGNLWIASIDGKVLHQLTAGTDLEGDPAWSPDGKTIVFTARTNEVFDLWSVSADGSGLRQLTKSSRNNTQPAWSPDGSKIAFISDRAGTRDVWVIDANGLNATRVTTLPGQESHPSFSPLGNEIVFSETLRSGQANLMIVKTDGSGLRNLTTGNVSDWNPNWSKFGIVFASNRSGDVHWKIWQVNPDGSALKQVGNNSAVDPAWMPNGQILFSDEGTGLAALSAVTLLDPVTGNKTVVGNVAGYLTPIDIRPGKAPNKINLNSSGTVAVAILSTPPFDATKLVDQSTLRFGATGNEPSLVRCSKQNTDVNFDGLLDLSCRFRISQTGFHIGDTTGILRFVDSNGTPYEGRDSVVIVVSTDQDPDDVDNE